MKPQRFAKRNSKEPELNNNLLFVTIAQSFILNGITEILLEDLIRVFKNIINKIDEKDTQKLNLLINMRMLFILNCFNNDKSIDLTQIASLKKDNNDCISIVKYLPIITLLTSEYRQINSPYYKVKQ